MNTTVATYRESDSNPKEQFVNHNAGLGGYGTGSYIDLVILRDKDANTAWTSASDGTLEQRFYYCQNWRADVVALVASGGSMLEWVKYSAYGVPFGLPGGDTDSDGDCDSTDVTQVQTWINASAYDVRGDIDLDGDVDSTDKSIIQSNYSGTTLGRNVLTSSGAANRKGLAGYETNGGAGSRYLIRHRAFDARAGRWLGRDPEEYVDGLSLYEYTTGHPITNRDPHGRWGIPLCLFWYNACVAQLETWFREEKKECKKLPPAEQLECLFFATLTHDLWLEGCMSVKQTCNEGLGGKTGKK